MAEEIPYCGCRYLPEAETTTTGLQLAFWAFGTQAQVLQLLLLPGFARRKGGGCRLAD